MHRDCLKEWVCGQILDNVSPDQMRAPNDSQFSWRDIVIALAEDPQFNYESDEDTPAMRSMALAILATNTTLRNMRTNHPLEFAKFAFDLARSISKYDWIVAEQNRSGEARAVVRITKAMLFEMAVEIALEKGQFSDLPRICKKLNENSEKPNYVLSGIVVPRATIAEWAHERNLPLDRQTLREIRDRNSHERAEAIENFVRQAANDRSNHWNLRENVMSSPVVRDTVERFEQIVSAYPDPISNNNNPFQRAASIMTHWYGSESCSYDNVEKRMVNLGLSRLRAENTSISAFGGVSQSQVLARLCSYIESPSHSTNKKDNIISGLAYILKEIGTHEIECPHGQVGALMSVPQGIDERDPRNSASEVININNLISYYQNKASSMIELERSTIELNAQQGGDTEILNEIIRSVIKADAYHKDLVWGSALIDEDTFNRAFDQIIPPGFDIVEYL
ncbi:MAG: hypothetical protein P8144_05380 [Gammaproteobacteria bacterium]